MAEAASVVEALYRLLNNLLPAWLSYLLTGFIGMFVLVSFVFIYTMFFTWMERRVIGRFQARLGPNRVGPAGLLQPVADAIKMLTKEDLIPEKADKLLFSLAPIVFFVPTLLVFSVIPFGRGIYLVNLNIGILFIIGISTTSVFGILIAGWASNNKYSLFGAMRAVAVLISYEIPMVLAVVGILIITGSLSMVDIVERQGVPFIFYQPLGFLVFVIAASAELGRSPFDVLEAESEIVAGYHTEYSGMRFGLFYVTEWAAALASSSIIATLFLGGWKGPVLPPVLWFLIKTTFVFFLFLWSRSTLPRVRIDQIMALGWKYLFPLALANILFTAAESLVFPDFPWFLIVVNIVISFAIYVVISSIFKFEWGKRQLFSRSPIGEVSVGVRAGHN